MRTAKRKSAAEHAKDAMTDVVSLIRFPVMSAKEFALGPARSDLLPLGDKVTLDRQIDR